MLELFESKKAQEFLCLTSKNQVPTTSHNNVFPSFERQMRMALPSTFPPPPPPPHASAPILSAAISLAQNSVLPQDNGPSRAPILPIVLGKKPVTLAMRSEPLCQSLHTRWAYLTKHYPEFFPQMNAYGFALFQQPNNQSPSQILPHQHNIIQTILKWESTTRDGLKGGIAHVQMGLGKTLSAYCVAATPHPMQKTPTLVVTNKSLLRSWRQDKMKFFGSSLKVLFYYKFDLTRADMESIHFTQLCQFDVVVTTYDVVQSAMVKHKLLPVVSRSSSSSSKNKHSTLLNWLLYEYKFQENTTCKGSLLLFRIPWFRVLYDESHRFANIHTKLFLAVNLLYSLRKSCLTGTPVRNFHQDMWAQFKSCGMTSVKNPKDWTFGVYQQLGLERNVLFMDYKIAGIVLPAKTQRDVMVSLFKQERQVYTLFYRVQKHVMAHFQNGSNGFSFFHVLATLLRLRQLCIAPFLLSKKTHDAVNGEEEEDDEEEEEEEGKKEEMSQDAVSWKKKQEQRQQQWTLANYFKFFRMFKDYSPEEVDKLQTWIQDVHSTAGIFSAKLQCIWKLTQELIPRTDKILIFSQFASALHLVSYMFAKRGVSAKQLQIMEGSDSDKIREQILDHFQFDPECRILLGTYGVMSVGLNLTQANHVIFLEPWWSGIVMDQSVFRAYRIGQTKPVFVWRVLVENSIEQRVIQVIDEKAKIIAAYSQQQQPDSTTSSGATKLSQDFVASLLVE